MSGGITRLKRLLGDRATASAVATLGADLRELQERVDALQRHVHELATTIDEGRVRQVEDFDAIRESISGVADDLSSRIVMLDRSTRPDAASPSA